MKRAYLLIIFTLTCFTFDSYASNDTGVIRKAQIAIIKEAIYFYSHVQELNPTHNTISTCSGESLEDLKVCAKVLHKSVVSNISKWYSLPNQNKGDLLLFSKDVVRVATKNDARNTVDGYIEFVRNVGQIMDGVNDTSTSNFSTTKKTNKERSIPIDTTYFETELRQMVNEHFKNNGNPALYIIIALSLLLSFTTLAKSFKLFAKKTTNSSDFQRGSRLDNLKGEINDKIYLMTNEINALRATLMDAEEELTRRINNIKQDDVSLISAPITHTDNLSNTQSTSTVIKQKLYATSADNGGFDTDTLSTEQDNQKIYEIMIGSKNTATYRVTENKEAQLLALEDARLYLRGACIYTGQPKTDSKIITKTDGELKLEGNKWKIQNKAEIEFK